MKTFRIDFTGSCAITAMDEETALAIFWHLIQTEQPLPSNLYDIQNVEEE